MKKNKVVRLLNDLIQINNDRIEGYETAADEISNIEHAQVKALFFTLAEDSRRYRNELGNAVVALGDEPEKGTTASGKIYRIWMDVKAAFSKQDLVAALESCEYGEDVALEAYQDALQSEGDLPTDIAALLSTQRRELRNSHDRIKNLRDEFKTVKNLK